MIRTSAEYLNSATGATERCTVTQLDLRGDLMLLRNGIRQLIDVTSYDPRPSRG
jgi:hypothetical protein